ncbi:hypothetical protein Tfer_0313 [Thermincola ferriacetica]|uniref:PASTA domain-containing protein n=2 Tax=Thermincola TaxID=278993 RepID=D5XEZ6_THEPJ|nr:MULTISPECIES: hypothetical protein [Thermincola]ADG82217.1 hypothetical protein TherJR_1360 [Thermincola potens JR]KNZ71234.1 hypothetical protein Tfer_0313 [Thermincola ferriacetica]
MHGGTAKDLPDLIGFDINEALETLDRLGYKVKEVQVTKPIFATEPIGGAKVVRLKPVGDNLLQVVVAYQDYLKGGA